MTEITLNKKREVYKRLPKELSGFMSSQESIEKTDAIAKKFSLTEEQDFVVDEEISLVLMGLQTKDDMILNLQQKAGLGKNKSVEIFIEAENTIFQKYRQWIPKNIDQLLKNWQVDTAVSTKQLPDGASGSLADHEEIVKNPVTINTPVTPTPTPTIQSPQPKITNLSWEERKKRAEEALKNIAPAEIKKYPGNADPYREPV